MRVAQNWRRIGAADLGPEDADPEGDMVHRAVGRYREADIMYRIRGRKVWNRIGFFSPVVAFIENDYGRTAPRCDRVAVWSRR